MVQQGVSWVDCRVEVCCSLFRLLHLLVVVKRRLSFLPGGIGCRFGGLLSFSGPVERLFWAVFHQVVPGAAFAALIR